MNTTIEPTESTDDRLTKSRPCSLESKDGCIASAMRIIGSKWTALILRDLADSTRRFSELNRSIPGMSPRTLSKRLDDLKSDGIISKNIPGKAAAHAEYYLTNKGRDLVPILRQMAAWGERYRDI